MNESLVTVITPTFNRAAFLGQAVESVLAQTHRNFELLVVDDGSKDNTPDLMMRYLEDRRVRYFYQENQGQSVARSLALSHARGDFIAFLDSNNAWLPDKLEAQLEAFAGHPEADVVYGDQIIIDETGAEVSRQNMRRHSGRITRYMLRDNCVSMNTAIARRSCFEKHGGIDTSYRVADDYDLWLRFSAYCQFLYLPRYLAYYRVMSDQLSSDKERRLAANEVILNSFLRAHGHVVSREEIREGWCYFYTRKGRCLAMEGRLVEAFRCYLQALRYRPAGRPPWQALAKLVLQRTG